MNTTRTPLFLMANLGSEVSKIFSAKERSDANLLDDARKKAQEIISQIVLFPEMRSRIPEMETLSFVISDITSESPKLKISRKNLSSYFIPFAVRFMQL